MSQTHQGHLDADSPDKLKPIPTRAQRALTPEQWLEKFEAVYTKYVEPGIHPRADEEDPTIEAQYKYKDIFLTEFMPLIHYMPSELLNENTDIWRKFREFLLYLVNYKNTATILRSLPPFKKAMRPISAMFGKMWYLECDHVKLALEDSKAVGANFGGRIWGRMEPKKEPEGESNKKDSKETAKKPKKVCKTAQTKAHTHKRLNEVHLQMYG